MKLKRSVFYKIIAITTVTLTTFLIIQNFSPNPQNKKVLKDTGTTTNQNTITKLQEKICVVDFTTNQFQKTKRGLLDKYPNAVIIEPSQSNEDYLKNNCTTQIVKNPINSDAYKLLIRRIYIPVTNLTTPINKLNSKELKIALRNREYDNYPIIWTENLNKTIQNTYSLSLGYHNTNLDELTNNFENFNHKQFIAFIPISKLNLKMKPLEIDDVSPFSNNFNPNAYPFSEQFWYKSTQIPEKEIKKIIKDSLQINEYDENNALNIILTGKTTLGAGQQFNSDIISKSLNNLSSEISNSNKIIINNTSPITHSCNNQNPSSNFLCGNPSILKQLPFKEKIVVDGAGYHIFDYKTYGFNQTLKNYQNNKIAFFGIGENEQEANKPHLWKSNKNNIAFFSFNLNPIYKKYNATSITPGIAGNNLINESTKPYQDTHLIITSVHQSYKLKNQIEVYNKYPTRTLINPAGSNLIFCPSSAIIKGVEYYENKLIFYGLGNFLINNSNHDYSRDAVIVKLYIYNNKILSYKLIPINISKDGIIKISDNKEKNKNTLNNIYNNSILWN